jgi:hypothetical protein
MRGARNWASIHEQEDPMKKLIVVAVAAMFSVSAAAYACDGAKEHAKAEKAGSQVVKKDTKDVKKADTSKKS